MSLSSRLLSAGRTPAQTKVRRGGRRTQRQGAAPLPACPPAPAVFAAPSCVPRRPVRASCPAPPRGTPQAGATGAFNRALGASGFSLVNVANVPIQLGKWVVGNDPANR